MTIDVVIIGSGPAGLSAAAHAAQSGMSHMLLEATVAHANTIQRYQKGKHVMAEPGVVPLRSELEFTAGTREAVLGAWQQAIEKLTIDIRYEGEVVAISGTGPKFEIGLSNGDTLQAKSVVLAIGLQGNPRKLGVSGGDAPMVQYTLDDPDEYQNETIVIVGAGDAAIENAVALANNNKVIIINRRDEFARVKDGNLALITRAIDDGAISCFYKTNVDSIDAAGSAIVLNTETGQTRVECQRIIARLGAIPPRQFVESCGVEFPNEDMTTLPELSGHYESNVTGLYIIGALGGYPLIKQVMNQGYEVIEYIAGKLDSGFATLQRQLSENTVQRRERQILEQILESGAAGQFIDYASAEQAFMAVQMLVFELSDADLEGEIGELADSLQDDERYRPGQFSRLLASLNAEQ